MVVVFLEVTSFNDQSQAAVRSVTASSEVDVSEVRPRLIETKVAGLIFPWLEYQLTLKGDESSNSYSRGLDGELTKDKSPSMN